MEVWKMEVNILQNRLLINCGMYTAMQNSGGGVWNWIFFNNTLPIFRKAEIMNLLHKVLCYERRKKTKKIKFRLFVPGIQPDATLST